MLGTPSLGINNRAFILVCVSEPCLAFIGKLDNSKDQKVLYIYKIYDKWDVSFK